MANRSQARIRRDINRLNDTITQHAAEQPALAAIQPYVVDATTEVNTTWAAYREAAVDADRERSERDSALGLVLGWLQRWRPVVLMVVPSAAENLSKLPAQGTTPDDTLRVAAGLRDFIAARPAAEGFRESALNELGGALEDAQRELSEATNAGPREVAARESFANATVSANAVLVRGSQVVRAIFGRTSPQYKQLVQRNPSEDEEDDGDLGDSDTPTPPPS